MSRFEKVFNGITTEEARTIALEETAKQMKQKRSRRISGRLRNKTHEINKLTKSLRESIRDLMQAKESGSQKAVEIHGEKVEELKQKLETLRQEKRDIGNNVPTVSPELVA